MCKLREGRGELTQPENADKQPVAPIRLVIADDHLVFRVGIRSLLGADPDFVVVGEAATSDRAIEAYRDLSPDILLLDLRLPKEGGLHVIQTVRAFDPKAKILILTSYEVEEEIFRVLQAGARGYALKDIDRKTLAEALHRVNEGHSWLVPAIAHRLMERSQRPQLTQREIEVLRLIGRGLTNREVANVLSIAESTVKNHINNLMAKLDVSDRTEALAYAITRGIITVEEL